MYIIIINIKTFEVLIKGRKKDKNHIRQKEGKMGMSAGNFPKTGKLFIWSTGRIGTGRPEV